ELIQALAIEAGNIAANAITADKIEAGANTAEKIQLGAVAPTNIAGAGQNHVTDPGFEDTAYWAQVLAGETAIDAATGSWEISTTTARNGGASIRANLNQTSGNAIAYITPEMPAPSSRQVYISGYCRAGGGSITPGPNTEVYISVRATRADSSTSYISEGLSQLTGTFQKIEEVVDLPSDAISYAVRLFVGNHDSQGAVFFDDACVMDVIGSSDANHTSLDPSGLRVWSGSSERIRIDAGGFSAWNNSGNKTVEILSSNGRATLTGSFRTGWGPPRIVIDESGAGNPAIYFQPPGSGDWQTPPNILAHDPDDDNPPSPAVQINSGVQTGSQKNNIFRLSQARGEFRIGNGEEGSPMLYAYGDDDQGGQRWALGHENGDTQQFNRAVVRGREDGTWRIGRHNVYINDILGDGRLEVVSAGNLILKSTGGDIFTNGLLKCNNGLEVVAGPKTFVMPHPTKPGMELVHAATEAPVSGIEYWGTAELGSDGRAVVDLHDYFEALAKERNRAVLVTPQGGPVEWTEIEGNQFTVTG